MLIFFQSNILRMKKTILSTLLFFVGISIYAQKTSLDVDCQNPGWLSNKISYLDQQSVKNLKVTGFLNSSDLKFIGTLMSYYNLKGKLDLSDVTIVKDENADNNEITDYAFNPKEDTELKCLELPKTLSKIADSWGLPARDVRHFNIDTLVIGGTNMSTISIECMRDNHPSTILIREGVEKITVSDNLTLGKDVESDIKEVRHIVLPSTIKFLPGCFLSNSKIQSINLPNSLEEIGEYAFAGTACFPQTIYMPKALKIFHFNIFSKALPKVVYLAENIERITNEEEVLSLSGYYSTKVPTVTDEPIEIHIKSPIVPHPYTLDGNESRFTKSTFFVPKDLVDDYKNNDFYKNATIIAEKEITNLTLNNQSTFYVGDTYHLSAIYEPVDATDKLIVWSSDNNDVVTISEDGNLVCKKYGTATIKASTSYDRISKNENILVYDHTTGVELNKKNIEMKVGDATEIIASTLPLNSSDGKVSWYSSNEKVATIDNNGNIIAHQAGNCTITCITTDRNYKEACNVKVTQPATGIELNPKTYTFKGIGKTLQLVANVLPEDASNKDVTWTSSDNSVCVVSNGFVVSIGYGKSTITATSIDGGYKATCDINVEEDVNGIPTIKVSTENYKIYTLDGKKVEKLNKGIYIIKFSNGNTQKIVIK